MRKNVNTPEVTEALDFLSHTFSRAWLVPQYRHALDRRGDQGYEREGQQQVLRPSFEGIRDSVRDALGMRLDKLRREFVTTQDMKVKKNMHG